MKTGLHERLRGSERDQVAPDTGPMTGSINNQQPSTIRGEAQSDRARRRRPMHRARGRMTMMRVLRHGTSGYMGGRLVPEFLARGHVVRCVVRDPRKLDKRQPGIRTSR